MAPAAKSPAAKAATPAAAKAATPAPAPAPDSSSEEESSSEDDSSEGTSSSTIPSAFDDVSYVVAKQALAYLRKRDQMRGWAAWRAVYDSRVAMKRAIGHMQRGDLSRCWSAWMEGRDERKQFLEELKSATTFLRNAELAKAFRQWTGEQEDARAMRRGLSYLVKREQAKCFHTWSDFALGRREQLQTLRQGLSFMVNSERARAFATWYDVAILEKKRRRLLILYRNLVIGGMLLVIALVWLFQGLSWWASTQPHPPPPPPPSLPSIVIVPLLPINTHGGTPHLKIWRPVLTLLVFLFWAALILVCVVAVMRKLRWGWFRYGDGRLLALLGFGDGELPRHALVSSSDMDTQTPSKQTASVALQFEAEDGEPALLLRSPLQLDPPPRSTTGVAAGTSPAPPRFGGAGGLLDVYTQTPHKNVADAQTDPEEEAPGGNGNASGGAAASPQHQQHQQPIHVHVHMHSADGSTSPVRTFSPDMDMQHQPTPPPATPPPPPPQQPPPQSHDKRQIYGSIPQRSPRRPGARGRSGEMY